jgi:DNA-binding HxlR family transcriptional regulator
MSRTSVIKEGNALSSVVAEATTATLATEAGRMAAFCPVYASLMDMLSRRWMGLVLRVLMAGPHRFSQIHAAVPGLSDPLLAQRLRELEAKALVKRRVLSTTPVHVEYELTEAGQDLERAVRALSEWASKWWGDTAGPAAGPAQ